MEQFIIKNAEPGDAPVILSFIKKLAEYEKLSGEVSATEKDLKNTLFSENPKAECLIGYENDSPAAFAVFFHNYSTFLGKYGIYLEDLFVLPEKRGKGYGKAMLKRLAQIAVERNCGRFEWSVLDWNEPAIKFYKAFGAKPMNEWITFRLTGESLLKLAEEENE